MNNLCVCFLLLLLSIGEFLWIQLNEMKLYWPCKKIDETLKDVENCKWSAIYNWNQNQSSDKQMIEYIYNDDAKGSAEELREN